MLSVSLIIDFWYKHLSLMLQGRLEETSLRESSLFSVEWVAGRNFKKDKGGFDLEIISVWDYRRTTESVPLYPCLMWRRGLDEHLI